MGRQSVRNALRFCIVKVMAATAPVPLPFSGNGQQDAMSAAFMAVLRCNCICPYCDPSATLCYLAVFLWQHTWWLLPWYFQFLSCFTQCISILNYFRGYTWEGRLLDDDHQRKFIDWKKTKLFGFRWNWDEEKKLCGIRLQISSLLEPVPPFVSDRQWRSFSSIGGGGQDFVDSIIAVSTRKGWEIIDFMNILFKNLFSLLFKGIVPEIVFSVFLWSDISAILCALMFCFKGTVSQDFLIQFFSWIIFPQAPENNKRTISNFFFNSQRYARQGKSPVLTTPQIFPPVPLVWLIPVANLERKVVHK